MSPVTTVVIPTASRPALLPLAVQSALDCSGSDVEVIVVPNGADASWRCSLARFSGDSRVAASPIPTPNANAARNHGLALAKGRYVRFLDDDDLLAPAAASQVDAMDASGAELCSGNVEKIDDNDRPLGSMRQQHDFDLVCAMSRPGRVCLPLAHLFRRSAIAHVRWDEERSHEQDTEWMLRLSAVKEWNWLPLDATVGYWRQHAGTRTSKGIRDAERAATTTRLLLALRDALMSRNGLTAERRAGLAEGLWDFAHSHFYRDPRAWRPIAEAAMILDGESRPADRFYESRIGRLLNPVLWEYLLVPARRARHRGQ